MPQVQLIRQNRHGKTSLHQYAGESREHSALISWRLVANSKADVKQTSILPPSPRIEPGASWGYFEQRKIKSRAKKWKETAGHARCTNHGPVVWQGGEAAKSDSPTTGGVGLLPRRKKEMHSGIQASQRVRKIGHPTPAAPALSSSQILSKR